jgi:hypothetical protein
MDNYQARKYFDIKKENYWINSYGSILAAKNKYILPSLNYIEENNAFLNLEQRPQQTSILFTKINNAKSPKFFLKYILRYIFMQKIAYEYNHYAFVKEMLKDLSLFKKIKTKLSFSLSKILFNYEISKTFFSTYVIKSIFEDFFLINNFCKNSLTMNKFSIEYRKINKNFYF